MIHSLDMEPEDVACLVVDRGCETLTEIRRRAVKKLGLARELGLIEEEVQHACCD